MPGRGANPFRVEGWKRALGRCQGIGERSGIQKEKYVKAGPKGGSALLEQGGRRSYPFFLIRRMIPAKPTKPEPKRSMVAGSGTGVLASAAGITSVIPSLGSKVEEGGLE